MNSAILILIVVVSLAMGYRFYGRMLSRLFETDPSRQTPAMTTNDGVDYVPARNWWVLFSHHFSSICGAGPIVGPALAVAYWGWVPAIIWIVVGCVLMGAVADFSSLMISVRHGGRSIAEISGELISPRARLLFSIFLLLALVLVLTAFVIFAAKTLTARPEVVIPSMGIIPVAAIMGWLMYRRGVSVSLLTVVGLGILLLSILAGQRVPVALPEVGGLSSQQVWIFLLMAYCFVAACLPVQYLLQPRDYLASFILFFAIGTGLVGILVTHPPMQAAPWTAWWPQDWAGAGPIWPMMFVTIACGAISGFHSLVSSGTTCKQLGSEAHACRIGYGGMLMEGLVGAIVVVCVGAGLTVAQHTALLSPGGAGPIGAFGEGYGMLVLPLLGDYGPVFAIMALNTFILTTLDSATRISRYILQELTGIENRFVATGLVVLVAIALALTGQWQRIWPAFGASNQLIAGLALLVVTSWLMSSRKPVLYTLIPAILMMLTTISAFAILIYQSLIRTDPVSHQWNPDWLVAGASLLLISMAFFMLNEVWKIRARTRARSSPV